MKCPRCGASMYLVIIYTNQDMSHESWKCPRCGEYIDDQILENRQESLERVLTMRKRAKSLGLYERPKSTFLWGVKRS